MKKRTIIVLSDIVAITVAVVCAMILTPVLGFALAVLIIMPVYIFTGLKIEKKEKKERYTFFYERIFFMTLNTSSYTIGVLYIATLCVRIVGFQNDIISRILMF